MTSPLVRRQLVALAVGVVVALVGAVAWAQLVADDDADAVLDEPGEYADPAAAAAAAGDGALLELPDVHLETADGTSQPLTPDQRPMIVNVWNSTCPPCERELREFATVDGAVGTEVRFVGVNNLDTAATMLSFAGERGVRYEQLRDPDSEFTDALGVAVLPVTLFVDPDGSAMLHLGALDEADLRTLIKAHWGIS